MPGRNVCKRVTFYGLAGLGVFCFTVVILNQWYGNPLKHRIQSMFGAECSLANTKDIEEDDILNEIKRAIDIEQKIVRDNLIGYEYPNGKYNISASKLEDLVIEENGRPIRSIILTSWRSGSSFLGAIIRSHPGNFHHFEPLSDFGVVKVRASPLAEKALKRIRALFNCEYADLQDDYMDFIKKQAPFILANSTYLWEQSIVNSSIYYDHRYLSAMCRLFPLQSMKVTRLRLHIAQELLADEKLAVRLALLVRDPRGTVQSRKHFEYCQEGPDCTEPALLCADLVSDYKIAVELQKKNPTTFRVIRYEDLATDIYNQAEEISKFYGQDFHPKVRKFLDTHTTTGIAGVFSLSRNTKTTPFHWREDLEFEEVEKIQQTCATAMNYWGYVPAKNATHQREFVPVTDYVLNL